MIGTTAMISTAFTPTLPAADRFCIYDDNSAAVHSKSGTFYAMQFFDRPDGYLCPHCECPATKNGIVCRHRRKLKAVLDAPVRMGRALGVVDIDLAEATAETECSACKEFKVFFPLVYVRRSLGGNCGYLLSVSVCGCGTHIGGTQ